jgi:eukaryotic-like serine/threonine-protein kinase
VPPDEQLTGAAGSMLALSRDGTQLAYVAGSAQRIYVRALDTSEAMPLTGTEGALSPFFSPDGQWIGFFAGGKLKKVSASGGTVMTLCDAGTGGGGAWGASDTIVFTPASTGTSGELSQISAAGGAPQPLTRLKEGELSHRWPQFLPDGKTILYTIGGIAGSGSSYDEAYIAAYRLDTGEQQVLVRGGTYPQYVPTGHLVYYRAGTIMAVPFDTARLAVVGTPVPAVEGVMSSSNNTGAAQFSFSSLGSLVYVPGGAQGLERTLVWMDRTGTETPLPAPSHNYDDPRLSPDGRQLAIQIVDGASASVWIYDIARSALARLTFDGLGDLPIWTPDGKRIVFTVSKPGANGNGMSWKPADGSGTEERLTTSEFIPQSSSVSPDGQALVFYGISPNTGNDIWIVPLQGERKASPFLQTPFAEGAPMFSPDGRWLAYFSNESGRSEIYVQPFPGPGGKWLISNDGGAEPVWSRNGRELFYRNGEKMMAVDIESEPAFKAGTPHMLFEKPGYFTSTTRADYDVSPDGKRFLMMKATKQQETQTALTQINVVMNWTEELKRLVPVN